MKARLIGIVGIVVTTLVLIGSASADPLFNFGTGCNGTGATPGSSGGQLSCSRITFGTGGIPISQAKGDNLIGSVSATAGANIQIAVSSTTSGIFASGNDVVACTTDSACTAKPAASLIHQIDISPCFALAGAGNTACHAFYGIRFTVEGPRARDIILTEYVCTPGAGAEGSCGNVMGARMGVPKFAGGPPPGPLPNPPAPGAVFRPGEVGFFLPCAGTTQTHDPSNDQPCQTQGTGALTTQSWRVVTSAVVPTGSQRQVIFDVTLSSEAGFAGLEGIELSNGGNGAQLLEDGIDDDGGNEEGGGRCPEGTTGTWPACDGNNDKDPDPIPEPSSLLLLGSGVLGLAGLLRRKLM